MRDAAGCAHDPTNLSARFHRTLAMMFCDAAETTARTHGLNDIVLAGGTFQNEVLLQLVMDDLVQRGFRVLRPLATSPNDGGLCLGQAIIARAKLD